MDNPNFNPNQQQNPNNAANQYQQPQGQQPPQGYNPNIPPYQGQYPQYPNQFQPQPPKKDRLKILKICAIGLFVSLVFLPFSRLSVNFVDDFLCHGESFSLM